MYVCVCVYVFVCVYTCMYVCVCVCVCLCVCIYIIHQKLFNNEVDNVLISTPFKNSFIEIFDRPCLGIRRLLYIYIYTYIVYT